MSKARGCGFLVSGTTRAIAIIPIMTIGTLTRNTEPHLFPSNHSNHEGCCKSMPPKTGPSAIAAPTAAAQAPIALPRSWGGNTTVIIARVVGSTAAPPTPITARIPISIPELAENAAIADATPKIVRPMIRTFLRPIRSPITPQLKSKAANTKI